jgi:imidazole glycerol-phosphate synthase subunit HisF
MLKTRVIGVVLVKDGTAVQSIGFRRFLPIGSPRIAVKYLDRWGVDEVVLLHIDGGFTAQPATAAQVTTYAGVSQMPLSVGGGIRSVDDVKRIIHSGADKVVLNTALIDTPGVIAAAAAIFGNQCIVVSIDARRHEDRHEAFVESGRRPTGLGPAELAKRAESLGAGEIFVTSIDRDGSRRGYDLELVAAVKNAVGIPVIACGGAGTPEHFREAMGAGASAVAAGNVLHYTEHSVITIKRQLVDAGSPVRLDSDVSYDGAAFDELSRLAKLPDEHLEHLRFRYIPEETI